MKYAGLVMLLLVAACAKGETPTGATAPVPGPFDGRIAVQEVQFEPGKTVTCVVWDGYRAGGISCDWANTKRG